MGRTVVSPTSTVIWVRGRIGVLALAREMARSNVLGRFQGTAKAAASFAKVRSRKSTIATSTLIQPLPRHLSNPVCFRIGNRRIVLILVVVEARLFVGMW